MMRTPLILFIEDDIDYADLIITILRKRLNYEVIWAQSPSEVREILKKKKNFDLIITDVELPEYNGDFIAKILNMEGILKDTPLLISSGLYDEVYLEKVRLSDSMQQCFYMDFCEKGKSAWLIFKIKQLINLRDFMYKFRDMERTLDNLKVV